MYIYIEGIYNSITVHFFKSPCHVYKYLLYDTEACKLRVFFLSLPKTIKNWIMLLIAKELQKVMREGTQDVNELAEYLMKNNSAWELAHSLADLMCTVEASTPRKIVVTQEEMICRIW